MFAQRHGLGLTPEPPATTLSDGFNTQQRQLDLKKGKENLRRPKGLGSKGSLIQM